MAKQKILLTNNLIGFQRISGSRDYKLSPSQDTMSVFESLFSNPNSEIIYNYSKTTDPRTGKYSKYSPLDVDVSEFFVNKFIPKSDFTMNTDPSSFCIFNLNTYGRRIYTKNVENPESIKNNNSTFTMNGKLSEINYTLPENVFYFSNLIFNSTLTDEQKEKLPIYLSSYNSISISGKWIKSITFNNLRSPVFELSTPDLETLNILNSKSVEMRELKTKKLEKLEFKNVDKIELNINRFLAPNLKTIDLTSAKEVKIMDSYQFYDMFSALNGSYINSYYNKVTNKIDEFKHDLVKISKHFDINCKFILSPDTVIEGDFFNADKRRSRWDDNYSDRDKTAKEIFKVNENNQVEFTLPQLAKAIYIKQRDNIQSQFKSFDSIFEKDIGKYTKELIKQEEEKERLEALKNKER